MSSSLVIFGLGSNLGNRELIIKSAVQALGGHPRIQLSHIRCSTLIENPALLPKDAPDEWDKPYLNGVCAGYSSAPPETLLQSVKEIETNLGRNPRGRWGPREIDIDILAYGDTVMQSETLIIPHPEMLKRSFVLTPLAEILPDWRYPGEGEMYGKTAKELIDILL